MSEQKYSILNIPECKSSRELLQGVYGQFAEAEACIQRLDAEDPSRQKKALREKKIDTLIQGGDPDKISQEEINWREAREKAVERRSLLAAAIEKQKLVVQEQERSASIHEATRALPEYKAIAREIAEQLIALGKLIEKERAFCDSLEKGQVSFTMVFAPLYPIAGAGHPRDVNSRFAFTLMEGVTRGYYEADLIPAEWREKWSFKPEPPSPPLQRIKKAVTETLGAALS